MSRRKKVAKTAAEEQAEIEQQLQALQAKVAELEQQRRAEGVENMNRLLRKIGVDEMEFREAAAQEIHAEALAEYVGAVMEWDDDRKLAALDKLTSPRRPKKSSETVTAAVDNSTGHPAINGENVAVDTLV